MHPPNLSGLNLEPLPQTLRKHRVRHPDKPGDIRPAHIVRDTPLEPRVTRPVLKALAVNITHDRVELPLDLIRRPHQPTRVLGHLEPRYRDPPRIGRLARAEQHARTPPAGATARMWRATW